MPVGRAGSGVAALALLVLGAAAPAPAGVGADVVLAVAGPAGTVATGTAPARDWRWPLADEPRVLAVFERPAHRWSPGHRGVDLAAGAGQAVLAPAGGTVTFVGRVVDRSVVAVQTPGGLRSTLEPVAAGVEVGDVVAAGDVVGTVQDPAAGRGHCAPGACLHWGVRRGSGREAVYLDPLLVLLAHGSPGPPVLLPWRGPRAGGAPVARVTGTPAAASLQRSSSARSRSSGSTCLRHGLAPM